MKNCFQRSAVALATVASLAMVACAGQLTVAERGKAAEYSIVLPEKASPSQKYAAEELRDFTEKATGVRLPIVTDAQPIPAKAIVLGGADAQERVPPADATGRVPPADAQGIPRPKAVREADALAGVRVPPYVGRAPSLRLGFALLFRLLSPPAISPYICDSFALNLVGATIGTS